MKIKVTQDDIDNGIPGDEGQCPIALALRRAYPGAGISVGKSWIHFERDETPDVKAMYHDYITTWQQWRFVKRFDQHKNVRPISFEFDDNPFNEEKAKPQTDYGLELEKVRERASKR